MSDITAQEFTEAANATADDYTNHLLHKAAANRAELDQLDSDASEMFAAYMKLREQLDAAQQQIAALRAENDGLWEIRQTITNDARQAMVALRAQREGLIHELEMARGLTTPPRIL